MLINILALEFYIRGADDDIVAGESYISHETAETAQMCGHTVTQLI